MVTKTHIIPLCGLTLNLTLGLDENETADKAAKMTLKRDNNLTAWVGIFECLSVIKENVKAV